MKRTQVLLRNHPVTLPKMYVVNPFPSPSQRVLWPSTRVTVPWGKGNNETLGVLVSSDANLTLIHGNPEHHCVYLSEQELMEVKRSKEF